MNQQTYNRWWQLHIRMARGEALTQQEKAQYEAGLKELDQEEKAQFQATGLNTILQLRTQIEELQNNHANLVKESTQLDEQIVKLEKSYQLLTGYQITI